MNVRQVKTKIKSFGNVKKITKSMQMISAIKMKKAQAAAMEGRPYSEGLDRIIRRIAGKINVELSPLLQTNASEKELVIIISSNKGLAGTFLPGLQRFVIKTIDFKKTEFITIGKKGAVFISRFDKDLIADFSSTTPSSEVSAIFKLAVDKFLVGEYGKVSVVYNKFISTVRSEVIKDTLLPLKLEAGKEKEEEKGPEYRIEPSPEEIIEPLLKSYLEEKIRSALLSSEAVEHSARMIAMKNATDNATDLIHELTLLGNKLRQTKITSELLDMITAKESVEA